MMGIFHCGKKIARAKIIGFAPVFLSRMGVFHCGKNLARAKLFGNSQKKKLSVILHLEVRVGHNNTTENRPDKYCRKIVFCRGFWDLVVLWRE